ncbi:MAG: hypothetical protein KBF88_00730 [Polyangiaceae bacterium]|nr:hypothetical protein [Polyangiaceae bacterium]
MRFKGLKFLLVLGVIGGFGSAFFHAGHCHARRHDAFEKHIADVCVEAAERGGARRYEGREGWQGPREDRDKR